jgi:translocation and assembly module TamB
MAGMSRRRFVALVSGVALLALGLVVGLVVVLVTQTGYGRDRVRDLLVTRVKSAVHGRMYVGHISGGLLGGVIIDSLEIRDPDDSLMLASGPVSIDYDARDLIDKRLLLSSVKLVRPVFYARRHSNGEWNFRRVFPSKGPKAPRGAARGFGDYIIANSVTIEDGAFVLTMPWHPPDSLRGTKRDSAIKAVLASTEHEVRRTKEGYAKTWRWTGIDAKSPYVRIADPDSVGQLYTTSRMSFKESDPPFLFHDVKATARVSGDSVWLDVPHWDLPGSTGSAKGKVVWGSDLPIRYAIDVVGDSVSLADVAWVYPTMPTTGGGKMHLSIRNDPKKLEVLDYALSRMDVRSTGSHITGAMTFAVGEPILAVKDLDVVASPIDFALIRQFNGKPFPVDWQGTISGTLKAKGGPLTRFRVDDANLVFRDRHVPGAETRATARGELDILYPAFTVFRGLDVDVASADLRTIQFLYPNFPKLRGTISGTATLDSSWLDVRFSNADVVQHDGPGEPTHVTGNGRITYGEVFMRYDLDLQAQPLSLTALARSYPMLPMRGLVSGPIRAVGTTENLDLTTTLAGDGGTFVFDGHLDAYPPGFAVRGKGSVSHLDARVLLERADIPQTDITARADLDVTADSIANLAGRIAGDLSAGSVNGVRIYSGHARLRAANGVLVADTLSLETNAATAFASGGIGLAPGISDSMRVALFVDSLGGLRKWVATSPSDSLDGSLSLTGVLGGNVRSLTMHGDVLGRSLYRIGSSADSLHASFSFSDITHAPAGDVRGRVSDIVVAGLAIASVEGRMTVDADKHALGTVTARSAKGQSATLGGELWMRGDTADARIDAITLIIDSTKARPGSRWALAEPATVRAAPGVVTVSAIRLEDGRGGRVALRATLPERAPVEGSMVAERVPLSDVSSLAQLPLTLGGLASARVAMSGTRAAPLVDWTALVEGLRSGAVTVEKIEASGKYADLRFNGAARLFRGTSVALSADASLPIDLALIPRTKRLLDDPLRGSVRTDSADLAILEAFLSAADITGGKLAMNAELGGTWARPTVDGRIGVVRGSMVLPTLGVRVRGIDAGITMRGDSIALDSFSALSDGPGEQGSLTMHGFVDLDLLHHDPATRRADLDPKFTLFIESRGFHVLNQRNVGDLHVTMSGLRLDGSLARSTLTGTVVVEKGVIYIPELARKRVIDLNANDPDYIAVVDTSVNSNRVLLPDAPASVLQNLALQNVRLVIGPDVWIRSAEANIQLGGEVGVTKGRDPRARNGEAAPQQLALQGALTADRGQYRLVLSPAVVRTFDVTRGRLTFAGDPDINPALDINAVHTVRTENGQDIRIRVSIRGTLAQPELVLSSDEGQQISQTDLVSYLAFGKPSFEVVGTGSANNLQLATSLVASTVSGLAEGFLQKQFGSAIDVFRVQTGVTDLQTATGQGSAVGNTLGSTIGTARVTLGKQFNERTFVGLDAGLCELNPNTNGASLSTFSNNLGVKVDHRLAHGFSLSAGWEPSTVDKQCRNTAGGQLATQVPKQIGLDLFKNWSF